MFDETYRFLGRIEISSYYTLSMSCQSSWLESFLRIHTPYSRRQILGSSEQEARITGPLDTLDIVEVGGEVSV
jgi:hypothetical protein